MLLDLGFEGWVRVSGGKVPTPEAWEVRQGRKAHRGRKERGQEHCGGRCTLEQDQEGP